MQAVQGRSKASAVAEAHPDSVAREAGGYKLAVQRPVGQRLTVAQLALSKNIKNLILKFLQLARARILARNWPSLGAAAASAWLARR